MRIISRSWRVYLLSDAFGSAVRSSNNNGLGWSAVLWVNFVRRASRMATCSCGELSCHYRWLGLSTVTCLSRRSRTRMVSPGARISNDLGEASVMRRESLPKSDLYSGSAVVPVRGPGRFFTRAKDDAPVPRQYWRNSSSLSSFHESFSPDYFLSFGISGYWTPLGRCIQHTGTINCK